jgi:HAD superfamily hydrolase (TIGR01490 family)
VNETESSGKPAAPSKLESAASPVPPVSTEGSTDSGTVGRLNSDTVVETPEASDTTTDTDTDTLLESDNETEIESEQSTDAEQDLEPEIREELARVYDAVKHGPQGPSTAAFFDLDKTILAKSSTLAFAKKFFDEGLIKRVDATRTAYAQFIYMISGADHDQMEQAREFMSGLVTGWPIAQVHDIVTDALDTVVDPIIYSEAVELIELHHAAGHDVIIISSSGTEVVEPIGERLGADIAIGTQMAVEEGKYTGEILFYAYGEHKAEAMQTLAKENGYDLADSFAYTDSFTDLPMLEVVGHPTVTNPDAALRSEAEEHGWNVVDFAKPVAMRTLLETKEGRRVAAVALAGAVGSAVALGLTRYVRRHGMHL